MKLQDYIEWKQIKWADFAKKLGVDPTYLSRLKHGRINWSPSMATRVEKLTEGHVRREELVWPE